MLSWLLEKTFIDDFTKAQEDLFQWHGRIIGKQKEACPPLTNGIALVPLVSGVRNVAGIDAT